MSLSARSLNRSTLARQMLLGREPVGVEDAVRRVVALQAQMSPSPYVAMWNRISDFDPTDLDAAFTEHRIVKATLMRMTLHAVHVEDYPCFREAVEPSIRATRMGERPGFDQESADAVIEEMLEFISLPRSGDEIKARISERLGEDALPSFWHRLRGYAPVWHAPADGTWTYVQRASFLAAHTRPTLADLETSDRSLQAFILRYLSGFGPASVADMAQFALVQHSRVKAALQSLSGEVERLDGPDGKDLFDVSGASHTDEDVPVPPRLMAMWDSTLLAYKDRSRIIPPDYRKIVIRQNGDVLPTLLVDGHVAGLWRGVEGGIEVTALHPLTDEVWEGIAEEARMMTGFLAGRDPEVYRRYHHWWDKMPEVGQRVLLTD